MVNRMYISVAEAEELTGISQWTWRAWAYSGRCASVKTGAQKQARLLLPVAEVERLMSAGLRPAIDLRKINQRATTISCGGSSVGNTGDKHDH